MKRLLIVLMILMSLFMRPLLAPNVHVSGDAAKVRQAEVLRDVKEKQEQKFAERQRRAQEEDARRKEKLRQDVAKKAAEDQKALELQEKINRLKAEEEKAHKEKEAENIKKFQANFENLLQKAIAKEVLDSDRTQVVPIIELLELYEHDYANYKEVVRKSLADNMKPLTPIERLKLLRNITATAQNLSRDEAAIDLVKQMLASFADKDLASVASHQDFAKVLHDSAVYLAAIDTKDAQPRGILFNAIHEFSKKLVKISRDPEFLFYWVNTISYEKHPKELVALINDIDFGKLDAAKIEGYLQWIDFFKKIQVLSPQAPVNEYIGRFEVLGDIDDLGNFIGSFKGSPLHKRIILHKYLKLFGKLNSVEETIRALQFLKKNFTKDQLYREFDFESFVEPILEKLHSFEISLDKYPSIIDTLEYFVKLPDIIPLKFEMAKHITGLNEELFKKVPAEVLDYVTKTYTELYGVGLDEADVLTWQFLNNLESAKEKSKQLNDLYEKVLTLIKPGILSKKPIFNWHRFQAWWNGRRVKGSFPHVLDLPSKAIAKILANLTPEQANLPEEHYGAPLSGYDEYGRPIWVMDGNHGLAFKNDFKIFEDSFNYFYDNWWKWYKDDKEVYPKLAFIARSIYRNYLNAFDSNATLKNEILKMLRSDLEKKWFFYRMSSATLGANEYGKYINNKQADLFFLESLEDALNDKTQARELPPQFIHEYLNNDRLRSNVRASNNKTAKVYRIMQRPDFLTNMSSQAFDTFIKHADLGDLSDLDELRPEAVIAILDKVVQPRRKRELATLWYDWSTKYSSKVSAEKRTQLTDMQNQLTAIINSLQPQTAQGQQPQAQG